MRKRDRFRAAFAVRVWVEVPLPNVETLEMARKRAEDLAGGLLRRKDGLLEIGRALSELIDSYVDVASVTDMAALEKVGP